MISLWKTLFPPVWICDTSIHRSMVDLTNRINEIQKTVKTQETTGNKTVHTLTQDRDASKTLESLEGEVRDKLQLLASSQLPEGVMKNFQEVKRALDHIQGALEEGKPVNPKAFAHLKNHANELLKTLDQLIQQLTADQVSGEGTPATVDEVLERAEQAQSLLKEYNPQADIWNKAAYVMQLNDEVKRLREWQQDNDAGKLSPVLNKAIADLEAQIKEVWTPIQSQVEGEWQKGWQKELPQYNPEAGKNFESRKAYLQSLEGSIGGSDMLPSLTPKSQQLRLELVKQAQVVRQEMAVEEATQIQKAYNPQASTADKVKYLNQLHEQVTAIDGMEPLSPALEKGRTELLAQLEKVWPDIQNDLKLAAQEEALQTIKVVNEAEVTLQDTPRTLNEAEQYLGHIEQQIEKVERRLDTVDYDLRRSLQQLGVEVPANASRQQLLAYAQQVTPAHLEKINQDVSPSLLADNTQAAFRLQSLRTEIEGLEGTVVRLTNKRQATGEDIRKQFDPVLEQLGLPRLQGDVSTEKVREAGQAMMKKLGLAGEYSPGYTLDKDIAPALQQREQTVQFLNTIFTSLGYTDAEIKARLGPTNLSDEGLTRGISNLRRELGLPDKPPGKLSQEDTWDLRDLLEKGKVEHPLGTLLPALQERQQNMQTMGWYQLDRLKSVIGSIRGLDPREYIYHHKGAASAEELVAYVQQGKATPEERDAILRLFTADKSGKLTPNDLFQMLAQDGKLTSQKVEDFRPFIAGQDYKLSLTGLKDMRTQAKDLSEALADGTWFTSANKDKVMRIIQDANADGQIHSLAVAYKGMYGKDLTQAITDNLSAVDKGEALHWMSRPPKEELQRRITTPDLAVKFLENPATTEQSVQEWFTSAPELAPQALDLFKKYRAATDPDQKKALFTQFFSLWSAEQGLSYLQSQVTSAYTIDNGKVKPTLSRDVEIWGVNLRSDKADLTKVHPLAEEAKQLYQDYRQETNPARKQAKLEAFIAKVAAAKDMVDLQNKRGAADLDKFIQNLDTARSVVKTGAVLLAGTAITIYTAGAGSGFLVSALSVTTGGTLMGGALEAWDQWSSKGKVDYNSWEAATKGHFQTSLIAGFGAGFAQVASKATLLVESSKVLSTFAKHPQLVSHIIAGTTGTITDTFGRAVTGQDVTPERALFAFFQGVALNKVGGSTLAQSLGGPGTEVIWSSMSGEKTDFTQGFINSLAVGMLTRGRGKAKKPKDLDTPDQVKQPKGLDTPDQVKQPKDLDSPDQVKKPKDLDSPDQVKKPKDLDSPDQVKKVVAPKRTKEHQAYEDKIRDYDGQMLRVTDEARPLVKELQAIEQPLQEPLARMKKLRSVPEGQRDLKAIEAVQKDIDAIEAQIGPQAGPLRKRRDELFKEFETLDQQQRVQQRELREYAKKNLPVDEVTEVQRKYSTDPADLQRVKAIRQGKTNISKDRNIAVADLAIDGMPPKTISGISGKDSPNNSVPIRDKKVFEPIATGNNPRVNDSEYKILNDLAQTLPDGASGKIRIFTERPCCISCSNVIAQFKKKFPKIEIEVSHGEMN